MLQLTFNVAADTREELAAALRTAAADLENSSAVFSNLEVHPALAETSVLGHWSLELVGKRQTLTAYANSQPGAKPLAAALLDAAAQAPVGSPVGAQNPDHVLAYLR